jgi:hypothetical protein
LFDEFGSPRDNFALARVLGVDYRGLPETASSGQPAELDVNFSKAIGPDYWERRKQVFDFKLDTRSLLNQGRMPTYVGDEKVTFKGPAVRVAPHGSATVVGTIQVKSIAGAAELPGVVTNTYGKGRVVYFAAGFDAAYYLYAYPYQRLAQRHAIDWAAAEKQPLVVDAPMCVHTTLMRQTQGDAQRLLVHLFSDLNTTAHHAFPNDDVPLREEVVPIHDIRLTFDSRYHFLRVHLEPGGQDLPQNGTAAGTEVVVPRLDVHAVVVAELGPSKP